jgi:hypothetical protein
MRVRSYRVSQSAWALALVIALLGVSVGCATSSGGESDLAAFVIELNDADRRPGGAASQTIERRWVSTKLWNLDAKASQPAARTLLVDFADRDRTGGPTHEIKLTGRDIEQPDAARSVDPDTIALAVNRPGASFNFTGMIASEADSKQKVYAGVMRVSFYDGFLEAARRAQRDPSVATLITAALRGVDANDLTRFAELDLQPSIDQIIQLVEAGASPANIQTLYDTGYRFTAAELVALTQANVRIGQAVALRRGGFDYSATQLVRLHEADVDATYAIGMKQASFADDVEQLVRLKGAAVTPAYARRVRELGVAHTVDDVIALFTHEVTPDTIAMFQASGYILTTDQLLEMKEQGVSVEGVTRMREAGYDFSREELLTLAQWDVPASFAVSLMSQAFEPLTADQIVDLHLRRVSPELVRVLRRPRYSTAQEPVAVPEADSP